MISSEVGSAGNRIGEFAMWYVVQVRTGTEESIRIQCEKQMSEEVLKRCFIPYYEEKKNKVYKTNRKQGDF